MPFENDLSFRAVRHHPVRKLGQSGQQALVQFVHQQFDALRALGQRQQFLYSGGGQDTSASCRFQHTYMRPLRRCYQASSHVGRDCRGRHVLSHASLFFS